MDLALCIVVFFTLLYIALLGTYIYIALKVLNWWSGDTKAKKTAENSSSSDSDWSEDVPLGTTVGGEWKLTEELGQGHYGSVFLAANLNSEKHPRQVAIKFNMNEDDTRDELEVHSLLEHKNIIQLFDCVYEDDMSYLILEYAPHGDLERKIQNGGPMKGKEADRIIGQIADGLAYIHSLNIIHGDMKLSNVLIGMDNTIKICDMGLALKVAGNDPELSRSSNFGALCYMAPEEYIFSPRTAFPCEVWSFGIVVVVIVSGRIPWRFPDQEADEYFTLWTRDEALFYHKILPSKDQLNVIRMCLQYEPCQRKSMAEIKGHMETKFNSRSAAYSKQKD